MATSSSSRLSARSLASCGLRHATSRSPGYSGEAISTRLRSSNSPSCSCPCSTSVRIDAFFSAVIQSMPVHVAQLGDGLAGDHAAVAHHHQLLDAEALAQALHLGQEGGAVGHVALVHRHRHRAAARVGEQPVVDLQQPLLAVAVVAQLGQRAGGALEVAGRQVVQHQAALAQVARGELLLDRVLAREQPVHRRVQVVLVRVGHAEVRCQRGGVPPARGGQLRVRRDDARGHHRQHQLALARGLAAQQRREVQALHRQRHGVHMAVRGRADDLERLAQRHEGLALQRAANDLDQRLGQMRQVAQRLVLDLAVLAVAAPQQVRAVDLALVGARCGDDVSGSGSGRHAANIARSSSRCQAILVTTF